jgi:imidazolonepropionase-like amidohydrolase
VVLVPTLLVFEDDSAEATTRSDAVARRWSCLRKAVQRGVRVVLGSDFVGWSPKKNAREFALMKKLGLSELQV